MRTIRTITASLSIAILASFTLFACEEKEQTKTVAEPVAAQQAKALERPKAQTKASTPEEVAKLYLNVATKMDIDMMKKITIRSQLEKTLVLESMLKMTANEKGQSFGEFMKELKIETKKKIEASGAEVTTATKVSDNGKFARVIVNMKVNGMEIPKPIEMAKDDGVWKVSDASQN
jgi:hypothetical protein